MDFDDQKEGEEDMGLPVESSYDTPRGNSDRAGGVKMSGGGGETAAAAGMAVGGSVHRKPYGGGGAGVKYRECLKNHAVGIGGHAVDGCGEFMAAGEEGSLDALRCAACGCHRNFHRKDTEGGGAAGGAMEIAGYHPQFSPYYRTPAGYLHHAPYAAAALAPPHLQHRPAPLALPSTSGGGAGHSRDEQEDASNPMMGSGGGGVMMAASGSGVRKRSRTKFTQEQKEKMLAFAEWLGWRIQKHDEAAVQKFCEETCVKRHVLKVWMHNNKHTLGKKP